jgi:hypothetical protein
MRVINTKEDWVLDGLEMLCQKGIKAVKIEALARKLGVTKASITEAGLLPRLVWLTTVPKDNR